VAIAAGESACVPSCGSVSACPPQFQCMADAGAAPTCVPTHGVCCGGSKPAAAEVCNDGKDNDCDGKVDCDDTDCAHAANCEICVPELTWEFCTDGKDNDCNGLVDCDDPQCQDTAFCVCTDESCDPGATRWCDGPVYCDWGVQTCNADRAWGRCIETNVHPGTCNPQIYDWSCCVDAGGCCQSPFDGSSVGDCPGVTRTCQRS
jgi:hypothetical protein